MTPMDNGMATAQVYVDCHAGLLHLGQCSHALGVQLLKQVIKR